MTQNAKTQILQVCVFKQSHKKTEMEIFAFCVIFFEPIRISQNDHLHYSFVKDAHTCSKNWPEIVLNCHL
jgi:hypothetical protein